MEAINSFGKGMDRSANERTQPEQTIFDSVNGQLFYDSTGNTIWRPINGNTRILRFDCTRIDPDTTPPISVDLGNDALHTPIGGCAFADCFVVVTVRQNAGPYDPMIIWIFQENLAGEVFGQVLMSDVNTVDPDDKFFQRIWNNIRMQAIYENDELYRIKWVDGVKSDANPPRSITFSKTGTVTNPTYSGVAVLGTFNLYESLGDVSPKMTNLMAPFKMGVIHFMQRIPGQLQSGKYVYLYRLMLEDGYRTPWSHHTNPVFVSTDIQDGDNMHLFEMEGSNEPTPHGNQLRVWGVDTNYETLEVAYVFIPDNTNIPTVAASFAFIQINNQTVHDVQHTSMSGEPLNVAEIISLRLNIKAAQTVEVKDEHLWHGNYRVGNLILSDSEIDAVLGNLKVIHIFRDMPIDRVGKTDFSRPGDGPVENLYNLPKETRDIRFDLNQDQEMIFPIVDDYAGYRGQQVDNTLVGYPRDEVVRYGIIFYDLEGNPSNVEHLCDYYFPKMYLGGTGATDGTVGGVPPMTVLLPQYAATASRIKRDDSTANVLDGAALALHMRSWLTTGQADRFSISPASLERPVADGDDPWNDTLANYTNMHETYARIQGIRFSGIDISSIKNKISGYAIVRCPIEYSTLAQGLVSPTAISVSGSNDDRIGPWPRPNLAFRYYGGAFGAAPCDNTASQRTGFTDHAIRLWDQQAFNHFLNQTDDFNTMYIPELMFGMEMPNYNQGQYFELTQLCWEEYNCGEQLPARRYPMGSEAPDGPWLCNLFNERKYSWHLLVNTRVHHQYIFGSPELAAQYSWNFHTEDADIPVNAEHIWLYPHNFWAAEYGLAWGTSGGPRDLFPRYGYRFTPDWLKRLDANEQVSAVDPTNPARFFHNIKWYYHPSHSLLGGNSSFEDDRPDDYYGGKLDRFILVNDENLSKRQAVGHNQTILFRLTQPMEDASGGTRNVNNFFAFVMPTYAEQQTGGNPYYRHDPKRSAAVRWMFNWKRQLASPYGGMTQNNLQFNMFVGTGHFQPVGNDHFDTLMGNPTPDILNNIEVWGGECWLDLHAGVFMYPSYAHNNFSDFDSGSQTYAVDAYGFIMVFPHEARMNLALRNAPSPSNPMSPHAGLRSVTMYNGTNGDELSPWADRGLFHYSGYNGESEDASKHLLEEFFINEVMGYRDRFKGFGTIPRGFRAVQHWPQRWAYSNRKIYGDIVDVFREFLVNNYRDLDGAFGAIMASAVHGDKIVSLQELAFGLLRVYERTILPTSEGQIVTGDASVIEGIRYLSESVGCQHPESVVASPTSLYWVDVFNRSIYMLSGEQHINLSDKVGMNQYLRNLLWRYIGADSIYGLKGMAIVAGYDQRTKRVTFSFPSLIEHQVHERQLATVRSGRYNVFGPVYSNVTVNGAMHQVARVKPVDKGCTTPQDINTGVLHIEEQDIVVLHTLGYGILPGYLYIDLYRGIYGSGTGTPLVNTVSEFYIVIAGKSGTLTNRGWVVEFANYAETSPTLTTPPVITPLPTSLTEKEGYIYHNSLYILPPPAQSIPLGTPAAVFHVYRSEKDAPFHIRQVPGNGSVEEIVQGIQMRGRMVFNEELQVFEPFVSSGDIFALNFRGKKYTAIETALLNGMMVEDLRSPEFPLLNGYTFNAFLEFITNPIPMVNKIFDALRLDSNDIAGIKSIRFSTEHQAVLIVVATDLSLDYIRRLGRIPVRRKMQLDRVRGNYLRVLVEIDGKVNRLAYVNSSRTIYRLSHKN